MLGLLVEAHGPQAAIKKVAHLKRKIVKKIPNYNFSVLNILIELEKNIGKAPSVIKAEAAVLLASKLYSYYKQWIKKL